jgi:hypothetical protein
MTSEVFPATPKEIPELRRFLASVFQLPEEDQRFQEELLNWKYFAGRPDWEGPRSYFLRDSGGIVAHGCLWPVCLIGPDRPVRSYQLLDWGRSSASPGAGTRLRRYLNTLTPTSIGIGGTVAAQHARARMGFQPWRELWIYRRVLRLHPSLLSSPKLAMKPRLRRIFEDVVSWRPLPPAAKDWTALPVHSFSECAQVPLPQGGSSIVGGRSPSLLDYLAACPAARCRKCLLLHEQQPRGYFLISCTPTGVKIADIWVDSWLEEDWASAYRTASEYCLSDPKIVTISAASSHPITDAALRQNGFRLVRTRPVALLDPQQLLPAHLNVHLQLADYDAYFM